MSENRIQVVSDASAHERARAVIRLNGIFYLPADVWFRIDPVDSQINASADPGWPGGERKPEGYRIGEGGLELQIGPDVVEARLLAPGTPVRISIPAAALSEELRWPDLAPRKWRGRLPLPPPGPAPKAGAAAAGSESAADTPASRSASAPEDTVRARGNLSESTPPDASRSTVERAATARAGARQRRPSLTFPFAMGFFLATGLAAGVGLMFETEIVRYIQRIARPAPAPAPSDAAFATIKSAADRTDASPRGTSARGVDYRAALARADRFLQATPPDRAEAQFWLEKAIALRLGGQDVRWGLTQLGSLYARRGAAGDGYLRAKVLWEIAAGLGEPEALCLLGALYERGLGVPAAAQRAAGYYAAAGERGRTCRSDTKAAPTGGGR